MDRRPESSRHVAPLDGLRGLAILLVMVYHFMDLIASAAKGAATVPDHFWFVLSRAGWCGVDLFFVLSGFLITGILLDTRDRSRYFSSFYGRRVVRIFPLYYGILFFLLVLLPLVWVPGSPVYHYLRTHQLWYWAHTTNWLIAANGGFGGVAGGFFWSLAVEEQFYLLWPLVVWVFSPRALGWICAALAAGSLALRLGLLAWGQPPAAVYVMTVTHLDPLAAGALLALAVRSSAWTVQRRRAIAVLASAAALGVLLLFAWRGEFVFWDAVTVGAGLTLLSLSFTGLLAACYQAPPTSWLYRGFTAGPLRSLGKTSYAVYLFHLPVAAVCKVLVFDPLHARLGYGPLTVFLYLTAAGLASWGAGLLSWHLFEKHFLKLKRYFTPGAARQPEENIIVSPSLLHGNRRPHPEAASNPAPAPAYNQ